VEGGNFLPTETHLSFFFNPFMQEVRLHYIREIKLEEKEKDEPE
jgi:hypothetical protein